MYSAQIVQQKLQQWLDRLHNLVMEGIDPNQLGMALSHLSSIIGAMSGLITPLTQKLMEEAAAAHLETRREAFPSKTVPHQVHQGLLAADPFRPNLIENQLVDRRSRWLPHLATYVPVSHTPHHQKGGGDN